MRASLIKIFVLICLAALCVPFLASCDPFDTNEEPKSEQTQAPTQTQVGEVTTREPEPDAEPYSFTFDSNGDGTCTVTFVEIDHSYQKPFTIKFPEESPDGERVTAIDYEVASNIPWMLLEEDVEQHLFLRLEEKFVTAGISDFYYKKFCTYFYYRNLSEKESDKAKEALLKAYPVCEIANIYTFESDASEDEIAYIEKELAYIGYTYLELQADYARIRDLIEASDAANKEAMLAMIPEAQEGKVIYNEFIAGMEFPEGLTYVAPAVYASCGSLRTLALPDCVTEIREADFYNNHMIEALVVSDGVTLIPRNAFVNCTALITLSLPASLQELEKNCFDSTLKELTFRGTMAEWEAVTKDSNWHNRSIKTVHCTDGDVTVEF